MMLTPEKLALKRATVEMIKAVGGLEAAAPYCRIGKTRLGAAGSNNDDAFVPIDVVADLEPLARNRPGWPHVTRLLAAQQGFALVALPDAHASERDHLKTLAALMKDGGDVAGALGRALVDGELCARDRAECRRELWELIETAVAFHAQLGEA